MTIDGNIKKGFTLPAMMTIEPSEILSEDVFIKLILNDGDKFMKNVNVVKNQQFAYTIFKEFIYLGNLPEFISYFDTPTLFDPIQNLYSDF